MKKRRYKSAFNRLSEQFFSGYIDADASLDTLDLDDNLKRVKRTPPPLNHSDTSGTDPGSTDISLNESDIPLINLQPRKKQDVSKLPNPKSTNLRSKSTIWYRPTPTVNDFIEHPIINELDETFENIELRPMSTPVKKHTVIPTAETPGPSGLGGIKNINKSPSLHSSSSSNTSSPLLSRQNQQFPKAVYQPKGSKIPLRNTTAYPKIGSSIGFAGEDHMNIFNSHLGTLASDTENPLSKAIYQGLYSGSQPTNNYEIQARNTLRRLDEQTHDLRMQYNLSKSWYERKQIRNKLQNIFIDNKNHPMFDHIALEDIDRWKAQISDYWDVYISHMNMVDKELRAESKL